MGTLPIFVCNVPKMGGVPISAAGLAGLAAARDLERDGAGVTVVEARDRVGGRVHTLHDGFARGQHAEAGADLIEDEQSFVLELARELRLEPVRILRSGFGYYGSDGHGRRRFRSGPARFMEVAERLQREINEFKLAGERWDSPVAARLLPRRSRRSLADRARRAVRVGRRAGRIQVLSDSRRQRSDSGGDGEAAQRPRPARRAAPPRPADRPRRARDDRGGRTAARADGGLLRDGGSGEHAAEPSRAASARQPRSARCARCAAP